MIDEGGSFACHSRHARRQRGYVIPPRLQVRRIGLSLPGLEKGL